MEKGTNVNSDSSYRRVSFNDSANENMSPIGVGTRKTDRTIVTKTTVPNHELFRLERSQTMLIPRQCSARNQKEQIILNTLEKNLTRQKQFCLQIQSHSILKYKQRLAGYRRLRRFSEGSINGCCILPQSEQLQDTARRDKSSSTHRLLSTSLVQLDDQSVTSVDVNILPEAGHTSINGSPNVESPRVYNSISLPCGRHFQQHVSTYHRAVTGGHRDHRSKATIRTKSHSISFGGAHEDKIHFHILKEKRLRQTMLKTLDSPSPPRDTHLLSVDESSMRPRAYTDPTSDGKMNLPEITIEDCSDPVDKANSNEGMFTVFQSPPRRRANTCPEEFFNRRRRNRPATPPPTSRNKSPVNKFSYGSNNLVSFVHHRLDKVSEDGSDARGNGRYSQRSQNSSKHASPRRSSCSVRSVKSAFSELAIKESPRTSTHCQSSVAPGRSTNGHFSVSKPEAIKISDTLNTSAVASQGPEVSDVYHSKDCRFSQKISPTIDGNPLQAC